MVLSNELDKLENHTQTKSIIPRDLKRREKLSETDGKTNGVTDHVFLMM